MTIWDDAAAVVRREFGEPVTYTGAGLDGVTITAIRSFKPAAEFEGFSGTPGGVTFEIEHGLLTDPDKRNLIVDGAGKRWEVIDINERSDIGCWTLTVEEAAS